MQNEISINIFSNEPDKNNYIISSKTFLINPNINSRSMNYLIGYAKAWSDHGCRVEVV